MRIPLREALGEITMSAIVGLLVAVLLTLLVNRIATTALMFTGLSHEMARFQARSALCTVGYTTSESEDIVTHPVRRRIIGALMLMGNMGFVTMIASKYPPAKPGAL